jgi:hypothetical protein
VNPAGLIEVRVDASRMQCWFHAVAVVGGGQAGSVATLPRASRDRVLVASPKTPR